MGFISSSYQNIDSLAKDILDPQPQTAEVLHRMLDWIDRADRAAQAGEPKPEFSTATGEPVFPDDGEEWWLTDFERR